MPQLKSNHPKMLTIQAIAWGLAVIDQTIFVSITENCNFIQKRISLLRWGLRVFPGCQDSYDLSECHRPSGLGRHKEPNHTDHVIHSDHSF